MDTPKTITAARVEQPTPAAPTKKPYAPRAPAPSGAPPSPHKYSGKLLGVDGWSNEQPGIFGTIVDASGRGVAGARVVTDKCDSNVVFSATTDANGAFNFNALYWKDSARWCVRTRRARKFRTVRG